MSGARADRPGISHTLSRDRTAVGISGVVAVLAGRTLGRLGQGRTRSGRLVRKTRARRRTAIGIGRRLSFIARRTGLQIVVLRTTFRPDGNTGRLGARMTAQIRRHRRLARSAEAWNHRRTNWRFALTVLGTAIGSNFVSARETKRTRKRLFRTQLLDRNTPARQPAAVRILFVLAVMINRTGQFIKCRTAFRVKRQTNLFFFIPSLTRSTGRTHLPLTAPRHMIKVIAGLASQVVQRHAVALDWIPAPLSRT